MEIMPSALAVCIIFGIWKILFSRIRFRIAVLQIMSSKAATRPASSTRLISLCVSTQRNVEDN